MGKNIAEMALYCLKDNSRKDCFMERQAFSDQMAKLCCIKEKCRQIGCMVWVQPIAETEHSSIVVSLSTAKLMAPVPFTMKMVKAYGTMETFWMENHMASETNS